MHRSSEDFYNAIQNAAGAAYNAARETASLRGEVAALAKYIAEENSRRRAEENHAKMMRFICELEELPDVIDATVTTANASIDRQLQLLAKCSFIFEGFSSQTWVTVHNLAPHRVSISYYRIRMTITPLVTFFWENRRKLTPDPTPMLRNVANAFVYTELSGHLDECETLPARVRRLKNEDLAVEDKLDNLDYQLQQFERRYRALRRSLKRNNLLASLSFTPIICCSVLAFASLPVSIILHNLMYFIVSLFFCAVALVVTLPSKIHRRIDYLQEEITLLHNKIRHMDSDYHQWTQYLDGLQRTRRKRIDAIWNELLLSRIDSFFNMISKT